MTARVEELLSQLEQIDYHNSPSESISSPAKSESNNREQLNFKRSLTALLASPTLQDSSLKTELQDLKVQLKVVGIQKKKEKTNMMKQCDKIDIQVASHKSELEKVLKQLGSLEAKAENVEKVIKEKQDEKLEAFRYALKPLEETANTVLEEKESLTKRNQDLTTRMAEIELIRSSKSDELKSLLAQRSEYSQNREKLQAYLSEIKAKDHCNYKEYVQELETKEILSAIKNRKSKQTLALKELEKKLAEIEVQLERSIESHKATQKNESVIPVTIEKEIEDMEGYINILCRDLGVLPLMQHVKEQLKRKGVPIEELIIKEQLELIDDKEQRIEESWRKQKDLMESKIIEMRRSTEEQEVEIYAMSSSESPSPQLVQALTDMRKSLDRMRMEAERAHRLHNAKISAINKWRNSHQQKLQVIESHKSIDDVEVIKTFKRELQKNIPKLDQWKSIENVVNRYLEKIVERNNNFQEILIKETEWQESQSKRSSVVKELQATKAGLLSDRDSLHKEFLKIITLEKAALKKFENAKVEIELERNKLIDKITEGKMSNNKSGLLQIQKTFGDKAIKKIREKELSAVKESQEQQREGVKKKLDGLSSDISHWESLISKIDAVMNDTIKPEIYLIDQETVRIKQELSVIAQQLNILKDAEDEVSAKLEFLMESKKRDIHRSLHRALEIHGGDVDEKKIHRLTLIRDKKESAIQQLLQEKEKIEKEYIEKLKRTDLEESRVKAKISLIEESIQSTKFEKKNSEIVVRQMTAVEQESIEEAPEEVAEITAEEPSKSEEISFTDDNMQNTGEIELPTVLVEETKEEITKEIAGLFENSLESGAGLMIELDDTTPQEQAFFQSILPLLQGCTIYKKLSQRNSLLLSEYDPLDSDSPEAFGFALRNIKLNKALTKIEFRHTSRPGVEGFVLVESLLAPVIPKHTSEMIKAQKKNWLNESKDTEVTPAINKKYREMKKSGLMNYADLAFKVKSREANNYPLFITLEKSGRVELVASGYSIFKQWIDGVNMLVKFKKQLSRLKFRIS